MTCGGGLTKSHPNSRPTAMISFLKEELSINLQRDEATFKSSETSFTLPKLRRYRRRDTDHFEDEAHSDIRSLANSAFPSSLIEGLQ
jgi:hypothetical protein